IFHPCGSLVSRRPTTFHVHSERRFSSNSPGELDVLGSSKVARFQLVTPCRIRSEERRVGKECRSRCGADQCKKNRRIQQANDVRFSFFFFFFKQKTAYEMPK